MVRRRWSVILERTVRELQGTSCIAFGDAPAPKQEIACTRSFGHPVTELRDLDEAVTEFASRSAAQLREQGSRAGQVMVFIRTSPFRSDPQYSRSFTVPLRRPSFDTTAIVNVALAGLHGIFRQGFKYAKAGVMLLDLQSDSLEQGELNFQNADATDQGRLMAAMDGINQRYGRGTVLVDSAGTAGD